MVYKKVHKTARKMAHKMVHKKKQISKQKSQQQSQSQKTNLPQKYLRNAKPVILRGRCRKNSGFWGAEKLLYKNVFLAVWGPDFALHKCVFWQFGSPFWTCFSKYFLRWFGWILRRFGESLIWHYLRGSTASDSQKNQLLLDALRVILIKLRVMPDPNSKRTFRTVIVDMRSNGNFVYVSQDAPNKFGKKSIHFWRLWALSVIIGSDS